jgi:hypothetical protein
MVRPQLTATFGLSAETSDCVRINGLVALPGRVVIERKFSHGRKILEGKKGEIVDPIVSMVSCHWEHPAIRIARMVHVPCGRAQPLAVDDVDIIVIYEKIQGEQIGGLRSRFYFSQVRIFSRDHFSDIAVDELAGFDMVGGTEAWKVVSSVVFEDTYIDAFFLK